MINVALAIFRGEVSRSHVFQKKVINFFSFCVAWRVHVECVRVCVRGMHVHMHSDTYICACVYVCTFTSMYTLITSYHDDMRAQCSTRACFRWCRAQLPRQTRRRALLLLVSSSVAARALRPSQMAEKFYAAKI